MSLKFPRHLRNRYLFLLDAVLLGLSTLVAYVVRFEGFDWGPAHLLTALVYIAVTVPLKLGVLLYVGLYRRLWRFAGVAEMEHILNEVDVLGTLVKHLAESVADVDQPVDAMARASGAELPAVNGAAAPAPPAAATEAIERIRAAVDAGRIEIHLQPIVTLPQRRTRFYEALTRLRDENGSLIMPAEYLPIAERERLMPKIDNLAVFRCVQVTRRLLLKSRDVGLFCNLSNATLNDTVVFRQILDFMEANRVLAASLMFEFTQEAYRNFGAIEHESLAALAERGFLA